MKTIKYYIGILGTLLSISTFAQVDTTEIAEAIYDKEEIVSSLDSMVNQLYVKSAVTDFVVDSVVLDPSWGTSQIPDSVYIQRLSSMVSPLNFPFNDKVRSYIKLYTEKRRDQVAIMLGLSEYYFPIFEEALDAAGLPLELKYLPIIESALNPRAFSRAGASGLWQFMYSTGKQYGLTVNSFIDERRDPIKSTQSAVRFLKDLYAIYGDWYLVIAAYNCGPGNVNKAIRRCGGKKDFWAIYYRLPKETRGYVPAFISAAYTMTYYKEHLISPKVSDYTMLTDTIMVSKPLHFAQISQMLQVSMDEIRMLNPQYRRDIIPAENKQYALRLSFESGGEFASLEDSVYNFKRKEYFPTDRLVINPSDSKYAPVAPKNKAQVHYTVKSGDVVGLIADWYDVYTSDLRYWNNISRNIIRVGQKLVVYVDKRKLDHYKRINSMSFSEKQAMKGKSVAVASPQKSEEEIETGFEYYTVRSGDSLWTIAQKYPGVTNDDLKRLNNLENASKLSPGQKLKIKKKS